MGLIRIRQLELPALIGLYDHERLEPQMLYLDLELDVDDAPCQTDAIDDAVDYDALTCRLREAAAATSYFLIERLAGHLMELIMADPAIRRATLTIGKPSALPHARTVEFELTRSR